MAVELGERVCDFFHALTLRRGEPALCVTGRFVDFALFIRYEVSDVNPFSFLGFQFPKSHLLHFDEGKCFQLITVGVHTTTQNFR